MFPLLYTKSYAFKEWSTATRYPDALVGKALILVRVSESCQVARLREQPRSPVSLNIDVAIGTAPTKGSILRLPTTEKSGHRMMNAMFPACNVLIGVTVNSDSGSFQTRVDVGERSSSF